MPRLQPQQTGGWTYYGAGGQYAKSMPAMPVQQEEDYSVEGMLNQQYQQQLDQIEQETNLIQQEATFKARYQMNTLAQKYRIEREHIEDLRIPADKKREKLLALNAKYELAATTIRGKIQPDLDSLRMQQRQAMQQAQVGLQNKLKELQLIERNGQEWGIDPKMIEVRKLQAIGVPIPAAWAKEQDPMEQAYALTKQIIKLETAVENATGEERKQILNQIEILENRKTEVMAGFVPGFAKGAAKTATRFTRAAAAAGAGRKPGTLAEGMVREKQKALKIDTTQFRGFAPIVKTEKKKEIKPKYQRNKTTGEMRVSYDGGKTWRVIG